MAYFHGDARLVLLEALALLLQGRDVESGAALACSVADFHGDALAALARSERVEEGQLEATRGSALEAKKGVGRCNDVASLEWRGAQRDNGLKRMARWRGARLLCYRLSLSLGVPWDYVCVSS